MIESSFYQSSISQQSIEDFADNCIIWLPKVCHILVDQWQISTEKSASILSLSQPTLNQALVGECPEFTSKESAIRGSIVLELAKELEKKLGNVRTVSLWLDQENEHEFLEGQSVRSMLETQGYRGLPVLKSILDSWK